MFFAETQNKLLYAVAGKTAAEIIVSRANANAPNMALTSWKGSIVRKQDIYTAKNFLTIDEIDTLNRLVVIFLETAELRVKNRQDITMNFWKENVDRMLEYNERAILKNIGSISTIQMEKMVTDIYEQFNQKRKIAEMFEADAQDVIEIENIEKKIKKRK
jgi:hypothetical protein